MAVGKNVGLRGLTYKGGSPMWSWLLHRISGLGMITFVSLHVVASFFMHVVADGGDVAININMIYESWPFQIFIYFCVIFHALNGFRIIMLDFWPKLLQYQRELTWLEWLVFVPVYGLTIFLVAQKALAGG
jgi:succinate dehydrogenase / fumarate reductase cytochrome b subunit